MSPASPILAVEDIEVKFPVYGGVFGGRRIGTVNAVDGVSFEVYPGETLGVVGESGCGKTTTGLAILRMVDIASGRILFDGDDISTLGRTAMRPLRRKMQMVYRDPFGALDPRMRVKDIIGEPLVAHGVSGNRSAYRGRILELMNMVGLDVHMGERYPHEFSGGQRQRIGIARALALRPKLLVCDEPVSALDVSIQAQIINLLETLQDELGLTYLFIAHDLSVVKHISDRIAVMYLGHIVELSEANELYNNPVHAYTRALLSAVPIPDPVVEKTRERIILEGDVPSPLNPPAGCVFKTRCTKGDGCRCSETTPVLAEVSPGHWVANCECCMAA